MDVACELGCKSVVMSGIPPFAEQDMESMARCYAEYFARVEGMASQRGLKFCYHPSAAELRAVQGVSFLNLVADDAITCRVRLQLDTFEVLKSGVDIYALLRRYKGRVESLHLHDIDVVCQSEEIDFERVVRCANECGVDNLIIEQHNFTLPPLSSVERSLQNVMTLPSVKW
jgi:sugar phosphate isomerase/epimerase